jgi:hypothetical protein
MQMNSDGATFSRAKQSFTTVVGTTYEVSGNITVHGTSNKIEVGTSDEASDLLNYTTVGTGDIPIQTFRATGTTTHINVEDGSNGTGSTYASVSVKPVQLAGYWRNNGLSTWQDLTSNDNDGTPTSMTETMLIPQGVDGSRDSQGFIMNRQRNTSNLNLTEGSDEAYVVVKNNPTIQFGGGGSVGFWMKPKGTPTSDGYCILNNGAAQSRNPRITLQSDLKINLFWERADETNEDTDATSAVTEGEWTYVVCTWNGTTNKIYLNDALDKSEAESGTPDTDTADLHIGKDQTGADEKFKGYLDGITFYSDVLSLEEVKRNYNATKGSHTN